MIADKSSGVSDLEAGSAEEDERTKEERIEDIKKETKAALVAATSKYPNSPLLLLQNAFFHFYVLEMNFIAYGYLARLFELNLRLDDQFAAYRLAKDAEGRILQAEVCHPWR